MELEQIPDADIPLILAALTHTAEHKTGAGHNHPFSGNGRARSVDEPLPTVTTRDRFALIQAQGGDVLFRMLRWPELARAQGFLPNYQFTGKVQEITKQIGNAVPRRLARAIVAAAIRQDPDVRFLETLDAAKAA